MTVIEILETKIDELSKTVEQLKKNGSTDKELLNTKLNIVEECEKVLKDEDLIASYDFSSLLNLLNEENLTIDNLEKMINEVKQVIAVKKSINIPDLTFSEIQTVTLKKLKENLLIAKNNILQKINAVVETDVGPDDIENLIGLKNILSGTGRRKYYTDEMMKSLSKVVDWSTISDEEFDTIINALLSTRNLNEKTTKEKENIEDVISLYKEFLEPSVFEIKDGKYTNLFMKLLFSYEEEITRYIDLDNTREILSFFKEKNILNEFRRTALLAVSVYADSDYVKKLYDKIMTAHPENIDIYFEDSAATLWVCESTKSKKSPFRIVRGKQEKEKESLFSKCHSVTDNEFWENVKCLNDNKDMFDEGYDISNIGAHLKAKTSPETRKITAILRLVYSSPWSVKKNIELLKVFKMGDVYKIPISSLDGGDIEKKIHLAIELGLLNPPMDAFGRNIDKHITTNESFLQTKSQAGIYNNTIRNYYARNVRVLAATDPDTYGFLKYKLIKLGYVDFYNYFFTERFSGKRAFDEINRDIEINMPDKDEFIQEHFIIDFYDQYIDEYDEYSTIIADYDESIKTIINEDIPYFNEDILTDELISNLENNYTLTDSLTVNDDIVETKSSYVYKFGKTLISRYKVLHNASILKARYGYLDSEMLLSSIVRNSYLTEDEFNEIKKVVLGKDKIK